jgi:hypothetical protein
MISLESGEFLALNLDEKTIFSKLVSDFLLANGRIIFFPIDLGLLELVCYSPLNARCSRVPPQ